MSYYYFMASVPALRLGAPPALAFADFRNDCRRLLPAGDLRELDAFLEGDREEAKSPWALAWIDADRQLRNALAHARAPRWRADPNEHTQEHGGYRREVEAAVTRAFNRASPLERETELDEFRWGLLEEIALAGPYGLPGVLAYAGQLRIAERWAGLQPEPGRARFDVAENELMRQYESARASVWLPELTAD